MNEVAVVTGASGGIGAAICEALRADQWTVVGLDRAPSGTVLEADITCPEALEKRSRESRRISAQLARWLPARGRSKLLSKTLCPFLSTNGSVS